jgi:COMPASS component SWD3
VHEDNASVTTVRFSPNGRYILAWTLDSCIRLWDYVSGTCKKTYQGHINKNYSLGGAFGVSNSEAFIVSGSEDGDILFWDVKTKEVVQRASGHEGTVCWVDTLSGPTCMIASGGLDGTVRIWVDVPEDGQITTRVNQFENRRDEDMLDAKDEHDASYENDTPRDGTRVDGEQFLDRMEEGPEEDT